MAFYTGNVEDVVEPLVGVLHNLPVVVKVNASDNDDGNKSDGDNGVYEEIREENEKDEDINKKSYGLPDGTEVMLQRIVKAQYARIKFTVESEYIVPIYSENETFDEGNVKEYLIPLACGAQFQYTHKPGSNGSFSSISELLQEPPCYVEVTENCFVRDSRDMSVSKHIPANTVVELKRIFTSKHDDKHFLECSFNNVSVAIETRRNIPTKAVINPKAHMLLELKKMSLFPKFINLQSFALNTVALQDYKVGDELSTQLEGPLEVIGVQEVEILVGWIRNPGYRSYETILIPCNIWNEIKVRQIHLQQKDSYLRERYGHCLNSNSIQTSLYVLPSALNEVTWLRLSDMFNRKEQDSFSVPDDVQLQFEDSVDDVYATMTEVEQPEPGFGLFLRQGWATVIGKYEQATRESTEKESTHKRTSMMQRIKGRLLSLAGKDEKDTRSTKEQPVPDMSRGDIGYINMMTLADCFSAEGNTQG